MVIVIASPLTTILKLDVPRSEALMPLGRAESVPLVIEPLTPKTNGYVPFD